MESRGPAGQWHGPFGIESADRSRVRLAVRLALPRLAVMQAGTGKTGISAMKGWEARDPQSQNGRGGRASLEQGKDSSERQKTCLRAARPAAGARDRASCDPGEGGYITIGGLFPDSFKQKAIACWGGEGAAVSKACWTPKASSGERRSADPVLSLGHLAP